LKNTTYTGALKETIGVFFVLILRNIEDIRALSTDESRSRHEQKPSYATWRKQDVLCLL